MHPDTISPNVLKFIQDTAILELKKELDTALRENIRGTYDLKVWFGGKEWASYNKKSMEVQIQFGGSELILKGDGTYILNNTSGG